MKKLLQLKHWQLFLLLVGIPFIFEITIIAIVAVSTISFNNPHIMFNLFPKIFPIMMLVVGGTFFGWFYALATNLHKKLPETVKMNLKKFKIFLFIPFVYIFLIILMVVVMLATKSIHFSASPSINPVHMAFAIAIIVIPIHLFSMFCIFYCLYFNAKLLKSVELQREVTFNDFAGEFFMIWFFPIGIWFIQPRINKIIGV